MSVLFTSRKVMLVFTLAALPFLVGSSCAFFWSSGSGSSDREDRDNRNNQAVIVSNGQFGNPPVAGLAYESESVSGTTGENGEFSFEDGKAVQFSIGDIKLGNPAAPGPAMSVADLVQEESGAAKSEVNIKRLLTSLDVEPGDAVITIPADVRSTAVTSNEAVAASIEFLDFSDDDVFASTASQLVAALTYDYPFTAILVDTDAVAPATRTLSP